MTLKKCVCVCVRNSIILVVSTIAYILLWKASIQRSNNNFSLNRLAIKYPLVFIFILVKHKKITKKKMEAEGPKAV